MKYPKFLKKGDKITLVAPSFGCTTSPYQERLDASINFFKNLDYQIHEGKNIRKYRKAASALGIKRAEEIHDAFLDKEAKIVASVGGGELMCEILDYLDFSLLSKNEKLFFGYSDNTNLSFLLNTHCDMASVYSMNFPSFGLNNLYDDAHDTLALLKGEKLEFSGYDRYLDLEDKTDDPLENIMPTIKKELKTFPTKNVEFNGRLIGGCLEILVNLCGTKYDTVKDFIKRYQDDKIIWFIESAEQNPLEIYRSLLQLKRAGWFENTAGFLFGRPGYGVDSSFIDYDQYDAVLNALEDLNVSIVFNADFGHIPPQIPILSGSYANIQVNHNDLKITYHLK